MYGHLRQIVLAAALCVLAVAGYETLRGAGSGSPAAAQAAQAGATRQILNVTGTGTVTLRPDRATIHFTTNGRATSLAAAENRASVAMRQLIAAMQAGGVAARDLQTNDQQAFKKDPHAATYIASQELTVTVRDPSHAGELVAAGVNAGAHSTYGPTFSLADQQGGYDQALAAAVTEARAKADAIAKAAGRRDRRGDHRRSRICRHAQPPAPIPRDCSPRDCSQASKHISKPFSCRGPGR